MKRPAASVQWPWLAGVALLGSGLFGRTPVVDALTGEPIPGVALELPPAYLVLAPIGAALDHLSLLTYRQHTAFLLSLAALFIAWRVLQWLHRPGRAGPARECVVAAVFLASVAAVYIFGILGKRPMALLRSDDPDLVIVDLHSHTNASHDGRRGLDLRARREWHRAAGFDVAYITDHSGVAAALLAVEANPALAGEGLSLLPGRQVYHRGQQVLVLGSEDPAAEVLENHPWPVLIQILPNDLSRVPVPTEDGRGGVRAIELLNADPRGLRQSVDERDRILALADSLDLALVAGSNHHGWGRTSAAWTLFRIPGWRVMSPEQVGREIESHLREGAASTVRVAERRRLDSGSRRATAFVGALMLPRLTWHILSTLTLGERLASLGWIGIGFALRRHVLMPGAARPRNVPEKGGTD